MVRNYQKVKTLDEALRRLQTQRAARPRRRTRHPQPDIQLWSPGSRSATAAVAAWGAEEPASIEEPSSATTRTAHLALGATRFHLAGSQVDAVLIPPRSLKEPPNPEPQTCQSP